MSILTSIFRCPNDCLMDGFSFVLHDLSTEIMSLYDRNILIRIAPLSLLGRAEEPIGELRTPLPPG